MLQMPKNKDDWLKITNEFESKCSFPHCIGAIDGKHVAILPPPNTGSLYFNYKHHFSIILLALVDASCRFLYVDIGAYGRTSDGGVFNNSSLAQALESNSLNIPEPAAIPQTNDLCPYVIVADDAFALKPYLQKPYSVRNLTKEQRIFNYRLSRTRRTVENAFGQLSQRFRVLGRPIPLTPDKVQVIVMAVCCLHNFLLRDKPSQATYMPDDEDQQLAASQQQTFTPLTRQGSNRSSLKALQVRDTLSKYFNSPEGSIEGQDRRSMEL